MEAKLIINRKDHFFSILDGLDAMRKDEGLCDFKIKLGSDEMNVHRNVLSACSKYFKAMMSHDTLENRTGVVKFLDCDEDSVRKCINFIYTGKASIQGEDCEKLMHVAHLLQLERLCDGICDFLLQNMTAKSFFPAKKLAEKYELESLDKGCDRFALENMGAISEVEEFKELEKDYILFLITSKDTCFSENAKCKFLIRWVTLGGDQRKDLFPDLIEKLDTHAICSQYQRHLVENEPLVQNSSNCMKLFLKSLLGQLYNCSGEIPLPRSLRRKNKIVLFDKRSRALQSLDPGTNKMTEMQSFDDAVVGGCCALVLHQYIYVIVSDRSLYRLDFEETDSEWQKMADMESGFCCSQNNAVLGDCIYVFHVSSTNDWSPFFSRPINSRQIYERSVSKFNPFENEWIKLQECDTNIYQSSFVACQSYIYSVGGKTALDRTCSVTTGVRRFNPITLAWKEMRPMQHARYNAAATECGGKIYVLGGSTVHGDASRVECYDPTEDNWVELRSMLSARSDFKALALRGVVYIVGGQRLELFDIDKNEWRRGTYLDDMEDMNINQKLSVVI